MKRNLLIAMLTTLALVASSTTGYAQGKGKGRQSARLQAAEGEEVWVVVNTIRADKRDQFEKFVFEILMPLRKKVTGPDRKAFIATRVLLPTKANDDGTWTYLFLMDPVIKGVDYQFLPLLTQFYGEAKAREYERMAEEAAAKPQTGYIQKQARLY